MSTRWTEEEYAAYIARQNRTAVPVANSKSNLSHALDAKTQAIQVAQKFRVRVTSSGRRLADTDGNSVKAVLDGITNSGIWRDDSSKFIKEVSFTQEAGEKDQTTIEVIFDE